MDLTSLDPEGATRDHIGIGHIHRNQMIVISDIGTEQKWLGVLNKKFVA
jgi:hypothetical protein